MGVDRHDSCRPTKLDTGFQRFQMLVEPAPFELHHRVDLADELQAILFIARQKASGLAMPDMYNSIPR